MNDPFEKYYFGKKVLITGHTGFKGTWLSAWLLKIGAKIIGFSYDVPSEPSLFRLSKIGQSIIDIKGDIRDFDRLNTVINKYHPDFIFHLAAQPFVLRSYREPVYTFETNVLGTLNLLECLRCSKRPSTCIIITSDKCYQNTGQIHRYSETDRLGGYDPYSASKACAELVVEAYRNSFFNLVKYPDDPFVSLSTGRAGNVLGWGDWGENR